MAKGRKHGSSDLHDLLLGTYGYYNGHVVTTDKHDLDEDDVWLTSSPDHVSNEPWTGSSDPDRVNQNRTGNWTVHNDYRQPGGTSLAFEDRYVSGPTLIHQYCNNNSYSVSNKHGGAATSTPVTVPSWSNMVQVDSTGSTNRSEESNPENFEWVPPHEYLAREHGRTTTTSVFEGVGRTLKGRDMSRVRDAVWSKTGFFG